MISLVSTLSLMFLACPGSGTTSDSGTLVDSGGTTDLPPDPRYDAFIAALEEDHEDNNSYGVSVAIWQEGYPLFTYTIGSRDADGEEPLTPDTLLQIGSTTKMFTATALLQQVQAGRLALTDSLADVLPDLSFRYSEEWAEQITLHDLLSMQSGFVDVVDWAGSSEDSELEAWHLADFPSTFWVMADPGVFFNYSNPGYSYAGYVTETVDPEGRAWADLIREDVFEALGMDRTMVRATEAEADGDWAESYGYTDVTTGALGTVDMSNLTDPASQRPAGSSTWSTPTQVVQMARFLVDGDASVLEDAHRALLAEGHVATEFEGLYADGGYGRAYGYGVNQNTGFVDHEDTCFEVPIWCHNGATVSFTSDFCVLPEHGLAISILSSGYGSSHAGAMATAFGTLAEGLPEGTPYEEASVDPEGLDRLEGYYFDPWSVGGMVITRDGDGLDISMPELEGAGYSYSRSLIGYTTNLWFVEIGGAYYDLSFVAGTDEAAGYIRNRAFVGSRVEDEEASGAGPAGPTVLPPGLKTLPPTTWRPGLGPSALIEGFRGSPPQSP